MRQRPWSSGPAELLNHGLGHLSTEDSDLNRRLAILSIDNSVEVMLRTYLSLPSRETGIRVSRSELREMGESFPKLLERIEELAPNRLEGVEWGILDEEMAAQLIALQDTRNRVAHGQPASLTWRDLNALHRLNTYLMDRI